VSISDASHPMFHKEYSAVLLLFGSLSPLPASLPVLWFLHPMFLLASLTSYFNSSVYHYIFLRSIFKFYYTTSEEE
ncbi:MAG: hypothetical protein IJJ69_03410, partial [Oscillospiraceae bacterium]|nr:hypothetical protein [Oscillospiraceae bacterium]